MELEKIILGQSQPHPLLDQERRRKVFRYLLLGVLQENPQAELTHLGLLRCSDKPADLFFIAEPAPVSYYTAWGIILNVNFEYVFPFKSLSILGDDWEAVGFFVSFSLIREADLLIIRQVKNLERNLLPVLIRYFFDQLIIVIQ